jgi:hypothetical protein
MQSISLTSNHTPRRVFDPAVALSVLIHEASSSTRRSQHQMKDAASTNNTTYDPMQLCRSRPPLPRTPRLPRRITKKLLPNNPVPRDYKSTEKILVSPIYTTEASQYSMDCKTSNDSAATWIDEQSHLTQRQIVIKNVQLLHREKCQDRPNHCCNSSLMSDTLSSDGESGICAIVRIIDLESAVEEEDVDDREKCFVPAALRMVCELLFPLLFWQDLKENSWYDKEKSISLSLSSDSSLPSMSNSDIS